MNWITNRPIAHRGLHDGNNKIPENSLKAFKNAIKKNYPVEFDIRFTNEGEIIVIHDRNLKRMTGKNKLYKNLTKNDLNNLKLINTDEKIPTFKEVLNLVNGEVPILIEIKDQNKFEKFLKKILNLLNKYKGEFAIQSFNPYMLEWFKIHAPKIKRGQLAGTYNSDDLPLYKRIVLNSMMMNYKSKPDFIAYNIKMLPTLMSTASRKKGLPVLGWVVDSLANLEKAKKYCDNIIFEIINPKDFK